MALRPYLSTSLLKNIHLLLYLEYVLTDYRTLIAFSQDKNRLKFHEKRIWVFVSYLFPFRAIGRVS